MVRGLRWCDVFVVVYPRCAYFLFFAFSLPRVYVLYLQALADIGVAVIHGGVSTFLAVVLLSLSASYVFRVRERERERDKRNDETR